MDAYLYPINKALVQFPIIALVITLPYMLFNYRKYGAVSLLRSVILFSFIFYLQCAYYMVILPLPDPASVANNKGPFVQWIPFRFVYAFLSQTKLRFLQPETYLPALRQGVFYQPLFNIALTLPFGLYLSYYFRENVRRTVLLTFALSLFFELTQLTGLYGIYPKPYRLFDVDDLMLNVLGGLLGYGIGRKVAKVLPSRRRMDAASRAKGQQVSFTRRLFATGTDAVLLMVVQGLLGFVFGGHWPFAATYFGYFVLWQGAWQGQTPGKRLVRIRVVRVQAGHPLVVHLAVKYLLPYLVLLYLQYAPDFLQLTGVLMPVLLLGSYAVIAALMLVDFVRAYPRGKRLWYEVISRTRNESTLEAS